MRFFRFLLVCWSLLLAASCRAQSRIDCNALNGRILKETVHYCVLLPAGYDSSPKSSSLHYPVLYFLHGLGENEQAIFKMGGWNLIEDLRRQHKITDFLIVTPDAKASFYVNSADGKVRYSDFFLREFIPFIESHYRVRPGRGSRGISGISMGGYGALRFAFAHPELFSAVSAESPALMTASPDELNAMMRSGTPMGSMLAAVFGNPIDASHWQENDPLALARINKSAIRQLAINFNCGRDDQFEFEVGAEKLHRELESEGIKHEYHLYPGDHSASYFLAHLSEVLEFHSQKFEAAK
jgi:S-formylglutathione hydrolase FrmB